MQFRNKNRIAYLSALTLLFSYAELFIPRVVPFFRIGLGNVVILLAFNLSPLEFLLLTVIKALDSSLISGTLFTPFFLISISQSVASGFFMYGLAKLLKGKLLSVFGISMLGSACSAVVQVLLCSLYLGKGTLLLMGPLLGFSVFSGILTAWLSLVLHIPETSPELVHSCDVCSDSSVQKTTAKNWKQKLKAVITILLVCACVVMLIISHKTFILLIAMILAFIAQLLCGRKIKLLPHIWVWLFVIIATLTMPQGKVLFHIFKWNITQGALLQGIEKALKLSAMTALSQCAANIKPKGEGILAVSFAYFNGLCRIMNSAEGKLLKRVRTALSATVINESYLQK